MSSFDEATGVLSQLDLLVRRIYRKIFRVKPSCPTLIDEQGVPMILYPNYGLQRNPATVCLYAIKYFESANLKDNERLFMNCVNWLMNNLSSKRGYSVWEYHWGSHGPWASGLAQGLGVKTLALAHKITDDQKFIKAAFRALNAFTVPAKDGGVLSVDENDGGWWYEEYPWLRSQVLNGHIEAMKGVYCFYKHVSDEKAQEIFQKGVEELARHLHEYDTGLWTYYDRQGIIANLEYHRLHVEEMFWLWKTTQRQIFLRYYDRWKDCLGKPSSIIYRYTLLRRALHA